MKRLVFGLLLAGMLGNAHAMKLGDFLKAIEQTQQGNQSNATQSQSAQQQPQSQQQLLVTALAGGSVSVAQEEEIGRRIAGDLLGAAPLVKDPALQRYVNEVGRWVALQSPRPDLAWHFGVIDSDDINAFSAPGGYVFITKGLYRTLKNEAELAARDRAGFRMVSATSWNAITSSCCRNRPRLPWSVGRSDRPSPSRVAAARPPRSSRT